MIEATNEKELLKLLSVISEEAVRLSKQRLRENNDPYVSEYEKQRSDDQKMYGSLSEQDDELEDEEETEDEELPDDEVELEDEEEASGDELEDEGEESSDTDASPEEFGVSFDSVMTAINTLRAGRSLKDTTIKDETSAYYDRLDDPERKVLLLFLKQLSEILSGALEGSAATDPSDVGFHVTDSSAEESEESADDEEESEEEEDAVITDEDEDEADDEEESEEEEEDPEAAEEDTSPPIKVNESQDLAALRKRVRRLMLRG